LLSALFNRDFKTYFDTVGAGTKLWLFVHVPKTAGSSMTAEVSEILRPAYNIDIDHTDTTRTYQAKFDAAVEEFVTRYGEKKYRFCTGHINAKQVEMIRAGIPDVRCFTMLRNPLVRIVSDYRYQRSPMNTARANFIANTPDFETYVARKHVHNKITLNLAPRAMVEAGDVDGCVNYITNAYAFVGLQEMYPLSLRALTTLMGETRTPEAKVRVNSSEDDKVEMSPELEKELREKNAVDIGVFKVFLQRYRDIREDLIQFMRTLPQKVAA
jgi:hypothetical protein